MKLTLVRHGATQWNASRRFQGHSDTPLSEEGRAQARALAARLSKERVDAIYASDLSRALETARIVAAPHVLDVRADARLREFAFGAWEGLTWAEIVATRPHLDDASWTKAEFYEPEGGETFALVTARMRAFLDDAAAGENGHAVVVTHAGALHAALSALGLGPAAGEPAPRFSPASLTAVAMEGGRARLITLNDVDHLDSTG